MILCALTKHTGLMIMLGSDRKMKMTDIIADMILDMFDEENSTIQIQRNDLASQLGCVPSQINYVITSRFTPEQGYRIESRRGGGGCIYITRADNKNSAIVALINSIGASIDERSAKANIYNLNYQNLIKQQSCLLPPRRTVIYAVCPPR